MSEWTEGDVTSDGVKIHFYRTGQGELPPIILSHGFTDNGLCWSRLAVRLQSRFDLVMVDARNHGQSDAGSAVVSELAADLASVISHLGLEKPAVIGHSVGASVVACLAAEYPDLVSQLILEDPAWRLNQKPVDPDNAKKASDGFAAYVKSLKAMSLDQVVEKGHQDHPGWDAEEFPSWSLSKQQVHPDAMAQLDLLDWTVFVPAVQCKTLLLYADEESDGIVTEELAASVSSMNSQISSQLITGAGHNIRREQFEQYADVVEAFLLS